MKTSMVFLLILAGLTHVIAQKSGDNVSVKTKDGNTYYGVLTIANDSIIVVETKDLGTLSLSAEKVKRINLATEKANGEHWFENPNATRNLYGPTGYGLRKGEAYYQNTWLFLHSVSYGVTDHFTIGGGIEIASLLFNSQQLPAFILTPKFSFPIVKDKFNAGAGVIYLHVDNFDWDDENLNAGIFYAVGTYGSRDNNVTLGLGYATANDEWSKNPIITVSGMLRVSRNFGLVTENWIIPTNSEEVVIVDGNITYREKKYQQLFSFGGRYIGESVTVDIAVLIPGEGDIGLPWLGVTFPFGR